MALFLGYNSSINNNELKNKYDKKKLHELYQQLWLDRQVRGRNYSELSGELLPKEANALFFHHILPKNLYPDLIYSEDNIIIITQKEHEEIENKYDIPVKLIKLEAKLKEKYS